MNNQTLKFLYLNFDGRIGRKTFWLYYVLPIFFLNVIAERTLVDIDGEGLSAYALFNYATLFVMISGFVKRHHDRGKSGLWSIVCYIPLIGFIYWVIACGILAGDDTANEYGAPAPEQLEMVKNAKT